jgi:hypothetical protein
MLTYADMSSILVAGRSRRMIAEGHPVYLGHDDVAHQNVNRAKELTRDVQSLFAVAGRQNKEPNGLQGTVEAGADDVFVVCDQSYELAWSGRVDTLPHSRNERNYMASLERTHRTYGLRRLRIVRRGITRF